MNRVSLMRRLVAVAVILMLGYAASQTSAVENEECECGVGQGKPTLCPSGNCEGGMINVPGWCLLCCSGTTCQLKVNPIDPPSGE